MEEPNFFFQFSTVCLRMYAYAQGDQGINCMSSQKCQPRMQIKFSRLLMFGQGCGFPFGHTNVTVCLSLLKDIR